MARTGTPIDRMGGEDFIKQKSEDYRLLGGINSKVNLYSNGPAEFRDLSNLNFISMGALSKRPGTTLFPGITFSGTTAGGVTSGVPDLRQITSGYEFTKLNGGSFLVISQFNKILQVFGSGSSPLLSYLGFNPPLSKIGSIYDFESFVDRLFMCNGDSFYRVNTVNNGISGQLTVFNYSLPAGLAGTTGAIFLSSQPSANISGISTTGIGLSGTYVFGYSFLNDRGFIGPASPGMTLSIGPSFSSNSVQYVVGNLLTAINLYGATAIILMRSQVDGVVMAGVTTVPIAGGGGATQIFTDNGITLLNTAIVASQDFDVTIYGSTSILNNYELLPRFLEVYNNQLFMAGFSAAPSTFWWSDIGEPEGVQPNFSTEVRSNDSDRITGMKNYFGSLVITKQRSVHLLSGTDPSNFLLQELSDQYGCLSNRCILPWNNVLWFLDSKGIMEYNGANLRCVSNKVEPIFNAMNISAALDNAAAIHVKKFNELWFSIPANGSTINNMIVVYDYVADSWTHYDGIQAQCLFNAFAGFPSQTPFYGGYTGGLMYFDASLTSDNDQGITCYFNSIFFSARGQSTQNQYRRFYLDVNPVLGFTQPINMTFQQDFGNTIQVARTMYQNPFQSRIDFGISARSIQASMYHYSASLPLVINGFTVESRFQRSV